MTLQMDTERTPGDSVGAALHKEGRAAFLAVQHSGGSVPAHSHPVTASTSAAPRGQQQKAALGDKE